MSDFGSYGQMASMNELDRVLYQMAESGDFEAVVLASEEGLPIASMPSSYDSGTAAAMAAMLEMVSREARNQLTMAEVDEVVIRDRNRIRLVCRYISTRQHVFILAVMVPPRKYYRRVTNRALRRIQNILDPL